MAERAAANGSSTFASTFAFALTSSSRRLAGSGGGAAALLVRQLRPLGGGAPSEGLDPRGGVQSFDQLFAQVGSTLLGADFFVRSGLILVGCTHAGFSHCFAQSDQR